MKTKIEFRKQNIPFTQVSNEVLKDTKLSFKAKGLYAYIYSKPEDWQFSFERIAKETADGEKAILSAIDELESAGLLKRLKQSDGRTIYWVTYPPSQFNNDEKPTPENRELAQKPGTEKAYLPKSLVAKTGTISNKELNTNKEREVIKNSNSVELQGIQWNELIDAFKAVNPFYEEFYRNTTERKALQNLVEKLTFNKVLNLVLNLQEINSRDFYPKSTKPTELKRNLGKLAALFSSEKKKVFLTPANFKSYNK